MSETFAREVLKRNVAQICQAIGWNGIHSTPMDMLVHVLEKYIQTLGSQANRYAEQFNRTEPNINDLGIVFQNLNVQIPELIEYTRCVPSVPPPVYVEHFPKPKESNLNFLKPGSHEVVTRPMHVHEHLPPMYPEKEQDTPTVAGTVEVRQNGIDNIDSSNTTCPSPEISVTDSPEAPKEVFKRPIDPVSLPNAKKPRLRLDEEERTREISSVMMTMSGFLSPAREGKLPEARSPTIISEKSHEKHKSSSHASHPAKAPIVEKSDKKSKKNKLINGKNMKSKRKDKNHKGESSKTKDSSKSSKYPLGHGIISKDGTQPIPSLLQTPSSTSLKSIMPPPLVPIVPEIKEPKKKEPVDLPMSKDKSQIKDAIPVPRKIPISKSPLVPNILVNKKNLLATNAQTHDLVIRKEKDEEVKLASQPDRSKISIFKRISNKSKEDKVPSEVNPEKSKYDNLISKIQNSSSESVRVKPVETAVNNNNTSEMDLRAHEVISIDDDSLEMNPAPVVQTETQLPTNMNRSLPVPQPKDIASESPKAKKKKHKDKKDKQAKLEAKLLKKQQQQLANEMPQAKKQKGNTTKPPKPSRPKTETKLPQMPPGFPFFPSARNMMPGPGLIPSTGLIPNNEFLAGFANNPALRGLPSTSLLTNPFTLSAAGPGLIPSGFLPGSLGPGINPLVPMGNFPHSSRSSPQSAKLPPMLRRPSLEVIAVENDDDRHKGQMTSREKERHDKHKSPTIPNILQKHKSKYKDYKSNTFKMPPVQPDITIELNPPREPLKQELMKSPPMSLRAPMLEPMSQKIETIVTPPKALNQELFPPMDLEITEKKKDKSHKKDKKDKKDKDGIKIKKKKDKKDKEKSEKHEKKKKKDKANTSDGLVPKLTLKLGSNSPMPPSSPDIFKLNIKPVVKKDEEDVSVIEEPATRQHSPSPELAQISALVTRPPKQKTSKQNYQAAETELAPPSPPSGVSPTRKNRPPSSHSKYKRILFKPLSKKGHFDDDMASTSAEEPSPITAPSTEPSDKPSGVLPTPFYVDDHGNKVWVCPACGRPDNGSPMIGCDGCDGWYHWVCVGITEEPRAEEDWFCTACIAKRSAMVLAGIPSTKKRGRKPKTEKSRDCH